MPRPSQRLPANVHQLQADACNSAPASAVEARSWRHRPVPAEFRSSPNELADASLMWSPTCPHARRSRAIGHCGTGVHACRCFASSREAPTSKAHGQPPVPMDRHVTTLIVGQRTELLNVRRQGLYHQHPAVGYRAATLLLGEHIRRRRKFGAMLLCALGARPYARGPAPHLSKALEPRSAGAELMRPSSLPEPFYPGGSDAA
jgi:hypothetical protein